MAVCIYTYLLSGLSSLWMWLFLGKIGQWCFSCVLSQQQSPSCIYFLCLDLRDLLSFGGGGTFCWSPTFLFLSVFLKFGTHLKAVASWHLQTRANRIYSLTYIMEAALVELFSSGLFVLGHNWISFPSGTKHESLCHGFLEGWSRRSRWHWCQASCASRVCRWWRTHL